MLTALALANYRSLRDVVVPLGPLTVVTGVNGSGESNLYRGLRMLAEAAGGGLIAALAREGGFSSTMWAGPERIAESVRRGEYPVQGTPRTKRVNLGFGFASDDLSYAIDLGLPPPPDGPASAFQLDPVVKRECIWAGPVLRPSAVLVDRRGPLVRAKADDGFTAVAQDVSPFESMFTAAADPRLAPELLALRERLRSWRFYDHVRIDAQAPARTPQIGTYTPRLAHDGSDLAAAWQTIVEIGDATGLDDAVSDAFPGAKVDIRQAGGRFEIAMAQHGLLRSLGAAELSDGTLRYLLLLAALFTPRPPELTVLNEPESSLHPDLTPALARLIEGASRRSQVIVVSHNDVLTRHLAESDRVRLLRLEKEFGETSVDLGSADRPRWSWPER